MKNKIIAAGLFGISAVLGFTVYQDSFTDSNQPHLYKDFKQVVDLQDVPFFDIEKVGDPESMGSKIDMAMWDEQEFKKIEAQIIDPWIEGWKNGQPESILNRLDEKFSFTRVPLQKDLTLRHKQEGISEFNWPKRYEKLNSQEALSINLESYLSEFKEVVDFDLVTLGVRSNSKGMRSKDHTMKKAVLDIKFDLRGLNKQGERRNDRGSMLVEVVRSGEDWKVERVDFSKAETLVASRAPSFVDATQKLGLEDVKSYVRHEAIRRGGYAISTTDIDNDGLIDMYVGTMDKGQLLKGQKDGSFKPLKESGIEGDTLVKSAVFADYNNDGLQDLLLVRFEPSFKNGLRNDDVHYYKNKGEGKFELVDAITHENDMNFAMPSAVADFDSDGKLDVYIGYPGAQDFTFFEGMRTEKPGQMAQGLYFNQGDHLFEDRTANLEKRDPWKSCCGLFPHSALAVDHNLNGSMDIVVIDDAGNLSPFYVNKGDGTFHQSAETVGAEMWDYGMSVAAGDLDNNGDMDLLYTSVNFHSSQRMNNSFRMNYHRGQAHQTFTDRGTKGVQLFKSHSKPDGEVKYLDFTEVAGLDFAGEGMAGVEFVDYNNDGYLDVYLLNGLWSGTDDRNSQDISSLFTRSDKVIDDAFANLKALGENYVDHKGEAQSQSVIMEILSSFKGNIMTAHLDEQDGARPSFAGHQRNRLFRNNKDGSFTEVGFLEGVDSIADGYVVALADLNKDGKMDLVLRNGDPSSTEVVNRPVEVFLNSNESDHQSVILALEGTNSNRDAIGAYVTAKVGDEILTRQLLANNGSAQSQKILHFGLEDQKKIDELSIFWPSGQTQKFYDVPAGYHRIKEGGGSSIDIVMK